VEIRILGPIDVRLGHEQLHLPRRQQRQALAILALHVNHSVSSDRLIDLLWGDRPPRQPRAVLQTRISELRAALRGFEPNSSARLTNVDGGYLLETSSMTVDAERFESLVDDAQNTPGDARKRELLREALQLWRGPILGENPPTLAFEAVGKSLDSLRLTAWEDLFTVELRLGNHLGIVDEAQRLVHDNPARERLLQHTMVALHRAGRSADALAEYERHRRWLHDELGVDPAPELQRFHLDLIRGNPPTLPRPVAGTQNPGTTLTEAGTEQAEPTTSAPRVLPRTLPHDLTDFTGRDEEVEALFRALGRTPANGMPVVVLVGPGGAGKTALAIHAAHRLSDRYPDGQLYANLKGWSEEAPTPPGAVLNQFLRLLGVDGANIPESNDERAGLYRALLADRRILVVLDNVPDSQTLTPLLPGASGCGVVVTARSRLGEALAATTLNVNGMVPVQATELLARIIGADRAAAEITSITQLCQLCDHLPLALRVVGATLAAKPHWRVAKLVQLLQRERADLNWLVYGHHDVRASISLSYRSLSPLNQMLLCHVGALGLPHVTSWQASAILGRSSSTAEHMLEQLYDAHLLTASRTDGDQVHYRLHDLIRRFAAEQATQQPAEVRIAVIDRLIGSWLSASDTAYRAIHGTARVKLDGSAPRRSIDHDITETIADDPLAWFDSERTSIIAIVDLAAKESRTEACWDLACTVAPLFQMRRYFDDGLNLLEIGLAAVRTAGSNRGLAAILHRMGMAYIDRALNQQGKSTLIEARQLLDPARDAHGFAIISVFIAMSERHLGRNDEALAELERALPTLQAHHDTGTAAFALRNIGQLHAQAGRLDLADLHFDLAWPGMLDSGWQQGTATVLFWRAMLRIEQGRLDEATVGLNEALGISQASHDRAGEIQCLRGLGQCYHRQGDPDRARQTLNQALNLARQPIPTQLESQILKSIALLD
jgi:DNA-binding SARP family transcriptional activator/tetratricopeptide (TPR) repeat protein